MNIERVDASAAAVETTTTMMMPVAEFESLSLLQMPTGVLYKGNVLHRLLVDNVKYMDNAGMRLLSYNRFSTLPLLCLKYKMDITSAGLIGIVVEVRGR